MCSMKPASGGGKQFQQTATGWRGIKSEMYGPWNVGLAVSALGFWVSGQGGSHIICRP